MNTEIGNEISNSYKSIIPKLEKLKSSIFHSMSYPENGNNLLLKAWQ